MAGLKNRTQLQSLFKSGAKPSGDDFADFINSVLNANDDGIEKPAGADTPLKILAHGAEENLLDFYADDVNTWRLNQKPDGTTAGLNLAVDGSSKLFIESSSGNVGISTASPTAKLHIQQLGSQDALRIDDEVSETTPLIVDAAGKMGLGIVTPDRKLHIESGELKIRASHSKTTADIATFQAQDRKKGLGIGSDRIQAIGSDKNQNIQLLPKGSGQLLVSQSDVTISGGYYRRLKIVSDESWAGIELVAREVGKDKDAKKAGNPHIDFTHGDLNNPNYGIRLYAPTNDRFIIEGGNVGIGVTPSAPLQVKASSSTSPADNGLYIYNPTDSENQHAILSLRVAGTKAGNPFISWDISGEYGYSMGIDNSDGNKLKIARRWESLTTNTSLTLDTSGNLEIAGKLTVPGAQQIVFADEDASNNLKLQLWGGYGLGINDGTLFYAANGNHSWRDKGGEAERMLLTTAADGALTVKGTGTSSFAGNLNIGGKVGVGTTAPPSTLTLNADIAHDAKFDYGEAQFTLFDPNNNGGNSPNGTRDIVHLVREGVKSQAYGNKVSLAIGRYQNSGVNARTQLDIKLTDGNFNQHPAVMSLRSNGNVGIGTTSPGEKLEVNGNLKVSGTASASEDLTVGGKLTIQGTEQSSFSGNLLVSGGSAFFPGHIYLRRYPDKGNIAYLQARDDDEKKDIGLRFRTQKGDGKSRSLTEAMTIDPEGKVGIGKTPGEKLDVNGNLKVNGSVSATGSLVANGDIQLRGGGDGGRIWSGYENGGPTLFFYDKDDIGGAIAFRESPKSNDQNKPEYEVKIVGKRGRIGIGTTNPTKGKVQIEGSVDVTKFAYGYLNGKGDKGKSSSTGGSTIKYSLYANERIASSEFNAHSDVRIKQVQGRSNSQADLQTLQQIEVTDYTLKDKIVHDDRPHKKVLGQQIAQVFPQAVSTHTEVVPDIFQPASMGAGWVSLSAHGLQVGERVKLLVEDNKEPEVYRVEAVTPDRFQVSLDYEGTVFVYGREVDDFHVVDYDELAMLHISATQELCKIIDTLKMEVQQLKAQLNGNHQPIAVLSAS